MEDIGGIFKQTVKIALEKKNNKTPNYNEKKCEDQFIGLLEIERNNARFTKWLKCSLAESNDELREEVNKELSKNNDIPIFLIVLESPHKDEYKTDKPMPAMGATGENIFHLLPKYINRINATYENTTTSKGIGYMDIQSGIYRVLLINAIQYQCSLGEATSKFRTFVFNSMWENEDVKKDFRSRVEWKNVRVVLNCCTNGNEKNSIRSLVQEEIDSSVKDNCVKLHSYHPSFWQNCIGIEPDGWKK